MIQSFIYLAIVLVYYLETFPKHYFAVVGLVFLVTVLVRGAARSQERDRLLKAKAKVKSNSLLE